MSVQQNTGLIQKAANKPAAANPVKPQIERLKAVVNAESVQQQFKNVLAENAGAFVASIIDLYNSDTYLQACEPQAVVMEALKAASLKLPINKQLGFAWIVPYKNTPTFQLGYKGYIQLCMRTGAYRYINADVVYEGELVKQDKLTGEIEIDSAKRTSDNKAGYFAFLETLNGFRKSLYMTMDEILKHAKKYSKSFGNNNSAWASDFDAMAMKTCLRLLLSKYGIMSVEMQKAYIADEANVEAADQAIQEGPQEPIEAEYTVTPDAQAEMAAGPEETGATQEVLGSA